MASGLSKVYVALVHHPVIDRNQAVITASVTNLDLHDIARSCRTFGVSGYFVVHPSADEQALNGRIVHHWETGYGERTHPTRTEALKFLHLVQDFSQVIENVQEETGKKPVLVGTSARKGPHALPTNELASRVTDGRPIVLVFGTGYGLASSWNEVLELYLEPICGPDPYNHLSVRSAVAIYLDRLLGNRSGLSFPRP